MLLTEYANYEQGKACGDGTILLDNVICCKYYRTIN